MNPLPPQPFTRDLLEVGYTFSHSYACVLYTLVGFILLDSVETTTLPISNVGYSTNLGASDIKHLEEAPTYVDHHIILDH